MASSLLTLRSIFKSNHGANVLNGIDLDVHPGEFFTLLGAPGCGNSTAISLIAGYSLPDRGQITLGGRIVTRLAANKRNTGIVLPEALHQHKTVLRHIIESVRAGGSGKRDAENHAKELLEKTGYASIGGMQICNLAGTQRLVAAILCAAAPSPDVLLLDEPFRHLDYAQCRLAKSEIGLLQRKLGIAFICSMENAEDALTISDRIALMCDGRVIQAGAPQAIYNQPETEFAAVYLGNVNLIRGIISATGGGRAVLNAGGLSLPCIYDEPLALEQRMCLAIYAERICFGTRQTGEIHLSGIIRENHFEGAMCRTILELPTGQTLAALRPSHEHSDLMPGQRVFLWWDIKDAALVEDGS